MRTEGCRWTPMCALWPVPQDVHSTRSQHGASTSSRTASQLHGSPVPHGPVKGEPQGKFPLTRPQSSPPCSGKGQELELPQGPSWCPEATPGQPPSQALGDVQTRAGADRDVGGDFSGWGSLPKAMVPPTRCGRVRVVL